MRELATKKVTSIAQLTQTNQDGTPDYSQNFAFIALVTTQIAEYFGAEWSDFTTKELSKSLYFDYYPMGVEGWVSFCKRLKRGDFGKIYGKFTPAMLVDFVSVHYSEWEAEVVNTNANGSSKFESKFTPISEAINQLKMLGK